MTYALPVLLLIASNVFMTAAWYGHLKYPHAPLLIIIFASRGIALFEHFVGEACQRYQLCSLFQRAVENHQGDDLFAGFWVHFQKRA